MNYGENQKTVLLTGAIGFVAGRVVDRLVAQDACVVALERMAQDPHSLLPCAAWYAADVTDAAAVWVALTDRLGRSLRSPDPRFPHGDGAARGPRRARPLRSNFKGLVRMMVEADLELVGRRNWMRERLP